MSATRGAGTGRREAAGHRATPPRRPRAVKAPDVRREEILAASRALFAEQGIARTSISDVAERVGVTRGLVYHYVVDKDTLVEAVLEQYIDEFVEGVRAWDAAREVGNIDKAVQDCIALFRRYLGGPGALGAGLPRIEDAGLYNRFLDRAVRAVVDCLETTTVEAYARRHRIRIEHVHETFYVLVHGLIGLARSTPGIDDRVLMSIVRQTLHLAPSDGALGALDASGAQEPQGASAGAPSPVALADPPPRHPNEVGGE